MAYGFRPVQMAGSRYQTGGFVKVAIEDATIATAIYNGGTVLYTIDGTTADSGASANDTPRDNALSVGVLVGATWENSSGEQKWGQYYDGTGTVGNSYAFIVPLDGVIFSIQGNLAWDRKFIGFECLTTGSGGSAATGNSNLSLLQVTTDAANACIIPVGVLENGNETTATPDVLVRFAAAGISLKPLF
jgi:hypothetical protein